MAKRWQRGRKDRDRRDPPISDPASTETPSDPVEEPGPDLHDEGDLASRLDSVTSRYERPPTAEELRAAFSRKSTHDTDLPSAPQRSFESTYTVESLFVATGEDLPDEGPETIIDDRSRTVGNYYYDPDDAWAVLGLEAGASWEKISSSHRRLAKLHHPDRLVHASPEEREAAEARMRDINVAYSVLRRLTGH